MTKACKRPSSKNMLTVQNFKPKLQKENYTNSHNFDLFSTTIPINSFLKKNEIGLLNIRKHILNYSYSWTSHRLKQIKLPSFRDRIAKIENVAATIARALIDQASIETIFNQRIT